jgi:hypothetical protein
MTNNERMIVNIEGTANVLFDKAATAETAEDAVKYANAAAKAMDCIEKLEQVELKETKEVAEAELATKKLDAEIEDKRERRGIEIQNDTVTITPKYVCASIVEVLKAVGPIAAAVIGGAVAIKQAQMQSDTTRECVRAATDYSVDSMLNSKPIETVDKAIKMSK